MNAEWSEVDAAEAGVEEEKTLLRWNCVWIGAGMACEERRMVGWWVSI